MTCAALLSATLALTVAPMQAQPMVLIPFGDSITHGLGDGDVMCEQSPGGYPPRLRSSLSQRGLSTEMRTRGVCGELTSEGISRLRTVLANNPDARLLLLMEGTNDLSNPSIGTESIAANIRIMVEMAFEAGVRPVVASVIPRAPEAGTNNRTSFFNDLMVLLTDDLQLDYVNQFRLLNFNNLFDEFYSDPFHPNAAGYGLVANNWVLPTLAASERPVVTEPCEPGEETLCLNDERFQVEVEWRDFADNTGTGKAVPLTSDTGYFYFFSDDNIELIVKALDGQGFNGNYWLFYGALSTVEYTITVVDTVTGRRKTYFNALDNLASVGDTAAFPGDEPDETEENPDSLIVDLSDLLDPLATAAASAGAGLEAAGLEAAGLEAAGLEAKGLEAGDAAALRQALQATPMVPVRVVRPVESERRLKMDCEPTEEVMCLLDDRFAIRARWKDFAMKTGTGKSVKLTSDSGYFWFFADTNVEVMVKVLDGRDNNGNFWVFYGALSNVEFEIEVTDTETGETVIYLNPLENFGSRADTSAFAGS